MSKKKVGWIWKHYAEGNTDLVKCNHCEKVFSDRDQMQVLQYHLYDEHEITELDEHPQRDTILSYFKISNLTATCNNCKKKINLAIHGVHTLTVHLKILHSIKFPYTKGNFGNKTSPIWGEYDIIDNVATCKGCHKIFKLDEFKYPLSNLRGHLLYCHPSNKFDKTKEIGRNSQAWDDYEVLDSEYAQCKGCGTKIKINTKFPTVNLKNHLFRCQKVWDKFVVTDNIATCKGCEKIVNLKDVFPIASLKSHLFTCLSFLNDPDHHLSNKDKLVAEQTRPRIWLQYDVTDCNATCKECAKTITINNEHPTRNLYQHARYCRFNKIRQRLSIWDKYDVVDNKATCKECKKVIKISGHSTTKLNQHLLDCHFDHLDKYEIQGTSMFDKRQKRARIWKKYDIISNNYAVCKECKKQIKINKYKCPSTKLNQHYLFCTFLKKYPSKYKLRQVEIERRLRLFNKFNITDNKATCKGCKKTIKINSKYPKPYLTTHLRYCCYFRSYPEKLGDMIITCKRRVYNILDVTVERM